MRKFLAAKKNAIALAGVCALFAWVSWLSVSSIKQLQGNARVINYAGIVRGATQRLIKQELRGNANDPLVAKLDSIVEELISGTGPNHLISLPDRAFQNNMAQVRDQWRALKDEIGRVRDGADSSRLYALSEDYFILVDQTVSAAEQYTEKQVAVSNRALTGANMVFILAIVAGLLFFLSTRALQRRADMLGTIAFLDPLTGLPNRAACHRELSRLAKSPPAGGSTVFMFDMNNLKRANDELGHKEGDRIIAAFGGLVAEAFRDKGFAGRYGGDEFVAFLPGSDEGEARNLLERLDRSTDGHNRSVDNPLKRVAYAAGYSIGGVGKSMDELMQEADRNMYEQKRTSRESIMEGLIDRIFDVSADLVRVAGAVNAASQELADASSGQRSLVAKFATATQTLHSHAEEYSKLAEDSTGKIGVIKTHAETGDSDMKRLTGSMTGISESVKEINVVLRAVNDIAFQTNILSLNAAVEAARAGRHGRGFSVVAEEVRKLANRSARSVGATNSVVAKSEENLALSIELGRTTSLHLNHIVDASREAADFMNRVAEKAGEQKTILTNVVNGLSRVETLTDQNSDTAEENARAAKQLLFLASKMRSMLDFGMKIEREAENPLPERTLERI